MFFVLQKFPKKVPPKMKTEFKGRIDLIFLQLTKRRNKNSYILKQTIIKLANYLEKTLEEIIGSKIYAEKHFPKNAFHNYNVIISFFKHLIFLTRLLYQFLFPSKSSRLSGSRYKPTKPESERFSQNKHLTYR